jgi:glycosyltransferase involved in cell wall biosynthesis
MFDFRDAWRRLLLRVGIDRGDDFMVDAEAYHLAGRQSTVAKAFWRHLFPSSAYAAVWLKRGRAQQNAGALADAEASLRKSIVFAPSVASSHVALARLLQDTGRQHSALVHYREALLAAPDAVLDGEDMARAGSRFRESGRHLETIGVDVYCDVSDLLVYLRDNLRVTGIQRVELSIVSEWFKLLHRGNLSFVFCRAGKSKIYRIDDEDMAALMDVIGRAGASLETQRYYLDVLYRDARPVGLKRDDIFMVLGAFWSGINYEQTYLDLKRRGIVVGALIHDLIPLTHAQFVDEGALVGIQEKFVDILIALDFACTVSNFVAQELRMVLDRQLEKSIPVCAVLLAHDAPPSGDGKVDQAFVDQLPPEYVLCVGTLDERKNHLLLLEVWTELCARHGDRTPPLLLVGKWGWRSGSGIQTFEKRLEETGFLAGKIVLLGNLSDAEVDYLYRHCLFSVLPSFAEGWGLPVGESLACGKPCIASNASSIPEVGGSLVRYLDPHDYHGAVAIIEKPLMDRDDLAAWTARIAQEFRPRSWENVIDDMLEKIATCAAAARTQPIHVLLDPDHAYPFGADPVAAGISKSWKQKFNKFVLRAGWHGIEDWGCWSARPLAELEFEASLPVGSAVCVRLLLRAAPPSPQGSIILRDMASGRAIKQKIETVRAGWVTFHTQVGPGNKIEIQIERTDTRFPQVEVDRSLFVGLEAIAYTAAVTSP